MASNDSPEARTSSRHSRCSAVSCVCSATCVQADDRVHRRAKSRGSCWPGTRTSPDSPARLPAWLRATPRRRAHASAVRCAAGRGAEIRLAVRSRILISRSSFALSKSRCVLRCASSCVARSGAPVVDVDENRHLGLQHLGVHGLEDVVDRTRPHSPAAPIPCARPPQSGTRWECAGSA